MKPFPGGSHGQAPVSASERVTRSIPARSRTPGLSHLAYPPGNEYAPAKRGVLELVETLNARVTAGEVPSYAAARLKPGLDKTGQATIRLQEALASWKPEEAQMLTEEIEDALDELDGRAR